MLLMAASFWVGSASAGLGPVNPTAWDASVALAAQTNYAGALAALAGQPASYAVALRRAWLHAAVQDHAAAVADPPRRDVLSKIVVGLMANAQVPEEMVSAFQLTRDHLVSHYADVEWLIRLVYLFSPDHEIFAKGYVPPKAKKQICDQRLIADPLGLLADLPQMSKTRGNIRLPLTANDKEAQL